MKFLHSMVRVLDEEKAMHFFVNLLGFKEVRRYTQKRENSPSSTLNLLLEIHRLN